MDDTSAANLHIVARELALIGERLGVAVSTARGLAAATDWQARAADLYHRRAEEWAGDVSGLLCLVETARLDAVRACEAARLRALARF